MNTPSPHKAGSAGSHGGDLPSVSHDEDDRELRGEIRARAQAVLTELEGNPPDWDAIETILRGAVETLEVAT